MKYTSIVNNKSTFELEEVKVFLRKFGIDYDNPEATAVIREDGEIIGTGSVDGCVMKYFYMLDEYKGEGLLSLIYNKLLDYLLEHNRLSHFIFTKPENLFIFEGIGLRKVISTDKVLLLEGGFSNYDVWVENVKKYMDFSADTRGAIVANCNPMTLGHKYLIEYAAEKVDELIVFVVEEDKSFFSTEERYSIVKKECENNDKILVIKGGPYIISQATFPTYFLKEYDDKTLIYTELDAKIFSDKIARDLDIDIRFVGEEPFDKLTETYNESLKNSLNGDKKLEIVKRKTIGGDVISASKVRKLLSEGKLSEAFEMLPDSTKDFLNSSRGKEKMRLISDEME